jgi:hypothetical protein
MLMTWTKLPHRLHVTPDGFVLVSAVATVRRRSECGKMVGNDESMKGEDEKD